MRSSATNFVGGQWHSAENYFPVWNPATLEPVAACADCSDETAVAAVGAAADAFPAWSVLSAEERERLLLRLVTLLEQNAPQFELLIAREIGKPLSACRLEVAAAVACLRWYGSQARLLAGRVLTAPAGRRFWGVPQPLGVLAIFPSWADPLSSLCRFGGAALASGCTVVVRPAAEAPLSSVWFAELCERAALPGGTFNLVTSSRPDEIASAWMADTRVRRWLPHASTGVMPAAALVFDDAPLEVVTDGLVGSRYRQAAPIPHRIQRVYATAAVLEPLAALLEARIARLHPGSSETEEADYGPLIHEEALEKVRSLIEDAVSCGAVLNVGGTTTTLIDPNCGLFFQPSLLVGGPPDVRLGREESFGPVLLLQRAASEEEALQTAAGASAVCVFTRDQARAHRLTGRLRCPSLALNTTQMGTAEMPFGAAMAGDILEYLETKSILESLL